jgi:hypothetical protein
MKLYKKNKKDFVRVDDYSEVKVGTIIKVYSEKSEKFINKIPYFVSSILGDDITLDSDAKKLNFNISTETLSLK